MSDNEQPRGAGASTAGAPRDGARSGWQIALPAITLVVGLVLGGLVVGVAVDGSPTGEDPAPTPTAPEGSPTDPDETSSPTGDVNVVVPQECLEAAATVEEATQVLRDGVGAIQDFDRQQLLDMLNRLEDLEAEAREQADQCSEGEISRSP